MMADFVIFCEGLDNGSLSGGSFLTTLIYVGDLILEVNVAFFGFTSNISHSLLNSLMQLDCSSIFSILGGVSYRFTGAYLTLKEVLRMLYQSSVGTSF